MKSKLSIGLIVLAIVGLAYYSPTSNTNPSIIKDNMLRDDVLRELRLEHVAEDVNRPNKEDLKNLTSLEHHYNLTGYENVRTLKGLEHAINLEELTINYNEISDITPLENLTKLHTLDLTYTRGDTSHIRFTR